MNTVEELEKKRKELAKVRRQECEQATKKTQAQLDDIEKELKRAKVKESKKHEKTWREASIKVGEMFQMTFLLYTLKDVDICLELTNHVQWIEIHHDTEYSDTYKYAEYENKSVPHLEEFNECYERVKSIFKEHGLTLA